MTDPAREKALGRRGFCATAAALALWRPASAAPPSGAWGRIDPVVAQKLRRGVSLSHWFWLPLEGRPFGGPDYLDQRDLAALVGLGLGHVRLPVDVERLFPPAGPDLALLDHLAGALDLIERIGLLALVSPFGAYNQASAAREQHNAELLDQLASWLVGRDPWHLVLSVINEPSEVTPGDWSWIQTNLVRLARARLPQTLLIASGPVTPDPASGVWGAHRALMQVTPPPDRNLVMALHWYEPFWLTHAGAPWLVGAEAAEVTGHAGMRYRDSDWQRWRLEAELSEVAGWAAASDMPLYVAEFGAFRYGTAPAIEREAWAADCVALFDRFALPWCWWDYAEGFGLATGIPGARQLDPGLVRALLRGAP